MTEQAEARNALRVTEAAAYLGVSKALLNLMRTEKWLKGRPGRRGPNYKLLPGTSVVVYLREDLDAYLAAGNVDGDKGPTAEQTRFRIRPGPGRGHKSTARRSVRNQKRTRAA